MVFGAISVMGVQEQGLRDIFQSSDIPIGSGHFGDSGGEQVLCVEFRGEGKHVQH